jgi:hypothetical protein
MGCIGGIDDSKGSTPRAALTVITEMKTETVKKASVSVSLFIGLINGRVDAELVVSLLLHNCDAVTVDIVYN